MRLSKITYFMLFTGLLLLGSCAKNHENDEIEVYDFEDLQTYLSGKKDKTIIVNFWATWCKPCVEELPLFEAVQQAHHDQLEVILVSVDFPNEMESKLKPFVKENNLRSQVILLDDPHENEWIPKVDSTWSGAIPATLIFNKNGRKFYEKPFTKEELEKEILTFTKK